MVRFSSRETCVSMVNRCVLYLGLGVFLLAGPVAEGKVTGDAELLLHKLLGYFISCALSMLIGKKQG